MIILQYKTVILLFPLNFFVCVLSTQIVQYNKISPIIRRVCFVLIQYRRCRQDGVRLVLIHHLGRAPGPLAMFAAVAGGVNREGIQLVAQASPP